MFISFIRALAVIALASLPCVAPVYATSQVTNSVSVYANSGSTVVTNGTVREGTSQASVDIVTIVNGETVVDIHKASTDEPIVYHEVTAVDDGRITTVSNTSFTTDTDGEATDAHESAVFETAPTAYAQERNRLATALGHITNIIRAQDSLHTDGSKENALHDGSLLLRITGLLTRSIYYVTATIF